MLTLILPVRDWPVERTEACIDSFVSLGSSALNEIIVVDFGSASPVVLREDISPIVKLVRLEADVWSCGEAINAGVLLASNEVVAKADSDMLITSSSKAELESMVAEVAAGRVGLGICQATDLHQSIDVATARELAAYGEKTNGRLRAKWGQGGLIFFSRSTWHAVGGVDFRFTGWGNEDNDFAERVRRSGRLLRWINPDDMQILHVWHPPSHGVNGILKHRQKNEKLARSDRSILRPISFQHSNFPAVASPQVMRTITPLVTLGIATTERPNHLRMIRESIDAFKGQIDHDFEILVVDNGSSEEAVESLRASLDKIRWAKGLIRLIDTPIGSIPAARNLITANARGRYICVVDDDDIALPTRLADHLRNFEQNGQIHGSHGGWIDYDEATGVIERNNGKKRTPSTLLRGTGKITAHPASFYRADVMRAVPYDEAFALGSDLDMALRMATLGMEIAHTGTYVTLRRYHSTNVTITGTSNQASNGATARARAIATYAWNHQNGLKATALPDDGEVYCRNQMSIDTLTDLMPDYTGIWQIVVPIQHLWKTGSSVSGSVMAGTAYANLDPDMLQKLLTIVDGDFFTRRSGTNLPIFFRSDAIPTLKKARKVKKAVEALLGRPVDMLSEQQVDLDRASPFQWNSLSVGSGQRRLLSEPYGSLLDLLNSLDQIPRESLLRGSLNVISDYDEVEGERYFLVTPAVKGYEDVRQLIHELHSYDGMRFHQVASNGFATELTPSLRSH